jgi:hypothetical protein
LERRLRVGELDDEGYLRLVDRALRLLDREVNPSDEIRLHGNLAAAAFECSEYGLAWRHCEAGYAVLRVSRATVAFPFEGWAALIMTVLRLWERQREEPAEAAVGELHLRSLAQLGLRKLREMSMMFPIARPRVVHCRGVYDYLCGRSSRARRLWSRGVADASAMDLDYDEALLRLELGRRGVLSPAASRSELEHARRLFSEHQVVSKAALCERTLGTLEA